MRLLDGQLVPSSVMVTVGRPHVAGCGGQHPGSVNDSVMPQAGRHSRFVVE